MSSPKSTVSGLVSGIDWETTISQLMQIERRPVTMLEDRKQENETKLSLWAQIQSKIGSLRGAMESMDQKSEFAVKSASSSDSTIVAVKASAAAAEGAHTVEVLQLAKAHSIAAQGWTDKNATGVGDSGGDLILQVGDETITIADADLSADTTLEELKNLINSDADNSGYVTASILDDGSSSGRYRLVLTSKNTGTANAISVTSNPTNLNFSSTVVDAAETQTGWTGTSAIGTAGTYSGTTNKTYAFTVAGSGDQTVGSDAITVNWVDSVGNTGSVQLASDYNPGDSIAVAEGVTVSFQAGTLVGGQQFDVDVFNPTLTSAQDARVRIDGIYMNKATNTVTDVLEGVTMDLLSADLNNPVSVTISNDREAVRAKIDDFVNAYNSIMGDISNFSKYDEKNKVAAPLLGDGFLSEIRSALSNVTAQAMAGLPDNARFDSLSVIGIRSSTNGLLTIDGSKLNDALDDHFDDVVSLFTNTFQTGDSKISLVGSDENTRSGEYSLVANYDATGALTSATINGRAATIDGGLIRGAKGTEVEGMVLAFASSGGGAGTVNTTIRFGKGVAGATASEAALLVNDTNSPVHYANENINNTIESLDRQIASWDERLSLIEERLRRQYSLLETKISQMKNQSNYLASVLG